MVVPAQSRSQSSVNVKLNIPLYSGGMTRAQVRESTERLYPSQDVEEDKRRGVVLTTRNAFCGITVEVAQGMAVTVEVKTDETLIIDYLLGPLKQHMRESLGER